MSSRINQQASLFKGRSGKYLSFENEFTHNKRNIKGSNQMKLRNGITLIPSSIKGPFASLGVFIKGGTRYETQQTRGSSHIIDKISLKHTLLFEKDQLDLEIEKLGGVLQTTESKEYQLFSAAVPESKLGACMKLFYSIVSGPKITPEDIKEVESITEFEYKDMVRNYLKSEDLMKQVVHESAFGGCGMGYSTRNLFATGVPSVNDVYSFWQQRLHPENIVIVGCGIKPEVLEDISQPFESIRSFPQSKVPCAYSGGQITIPIAEKEFAHASIAFKSPPISHPDYCVTQVLQYILGGGSAFSAGGPGKGMYSRLYTNLLNRYYWIESAMATNLGYSSDSLFMLSGSCNAKHTKSLLEVLSDQLLNSSYKLNSDELQRAKSQLKSALLMKNESRFQQIETAARDFVAGQNIVELIDSVQQKDVERVVDEMVKSPLSLTTFGQVEHATPKEHLQSTFGFK